MSLHRHEETIPALTRGPVQGAIIGFPIALILWLIVLSIYAKISGRA